MKFRRKASPADANADVNADAERRPETGEGPGAAAHGAATGSGPFDISEVSDDVQRIDLGALLVPPSQGRELRLQVDEKSGNVQAVLLVGPDGALEVQAFAAPRNGDLWGEVRPQIAADVERRGGTVVEREGRFGPELVCQMQVNRPDGKTAVQPSRIVGVNGPRWMLRASLLGRPAHDEAAARDWEDALSQVVVRRGEGAMPVGEPLTVTVPDDARRVD